MHNCYKCGNGNSEKGICEVLAAAKNDDPVALAITEWIGNNSVRSGDHLALSPMADGCLSWRPKASHYDTAEASKVLREGIARIRQNTPSKPLTASEALFAFVGWITTFDVTLIAGAKHDAAVWAHLVDEFIKANEFAEPREGWDRLVAYPEKDVLG